MSLPAFVSADGFHLLKAAGFAWHRGSVLFLAPHGWAGIGHYRGRMRGKPTATSVATVIKGLGVDGSQTAQVEPDLVQALLDAAHWDLRQLARLGPRPWSCSGCTTMNAHPLTVCTFCGERRWAWKDRKGPKRAPPRGQASKVVALSRGCGWCGADDEPLELVGEVRACRTCRAVRARKAGSK